MSFMEITWIPSPAVIAHDFYQLAEDINPRSLREPLKRSIQEVIAPAFQDNFEAGGRPAWTPLADRTLAAKAKRGQSDKPLEGTGKLRRKAGQLNIWTINGIAAEATLDKLPDAEYGFIHQTGGHQGSWSMPARPWAVIEASDIDKIEEVFGRWLSERVAHRLKVATT